MIALMYHDIVGAGGEESSGFPGRDAALYKVAPGVFREHLDGILREGYTQSLALTFDDGGLSAMVAAESLERRGLLGFFFITTNYIGAPGFLTAGQIRELAARGHTIGSHSCSHPLRMGHASWPQLVDEWTTSRGALQDVIGSAVTTASVPGGDFARNVAATAADAGYVQLFTSEPTRTARSFSAMSIVGRFTVQRWTSAATVRAAARGASWPWFAQAIVWNAKKAGKRLGGEGYLRVRQFLLS
jgi:peptidoglycan/xylan/chitin deacetylase (PgdA/CDA1 family)